MITIAMILLAFFISFCFFMLFRNNWVYKIRVKHCEAAYALMEKKIDDGSYDKVSPEQYYDCLWEYRKMAIRFWIWDLRKMVNDREKFDEVYETDDLEAVKKTVVSNTHAAKLVANSSEEELDLLIDAQKGDPAEYVAAGKSAVSSAIMKSQWHARYVERLIGRGKLTYQEAKDALEAGMGDHDYDDDPEDAADTELGYGCDG